MKKVKLVVDYLPQTSIVNEKSYRMAFSESVKDQAFARAGGRCECHRQHNDLYAPHHGGRCPKTFTRYGGQWEAHHIVSVLSGGSDTLSNCEVLCIDCHELTRTYGR